MLIISKLWKVIFLCKENAVLIYFKYAGAGLLDRNGGDGGDGEVKL